MTHAGAGTDQANAVAVARDFAGTMAVYTAPANADRYLMARAWLLLPPLWAARVGAFDPGWREWLPFCDQPDEHQPGADTVDIRTAAIELAEMAPQPWETGGPDALVAWYEAAIDTAHDVYAHWAIMSGTVLDPKDPWTVAAWRACHATSVLTEASYLAAGGILPLEHDGRFYASSAETFPAAPDRLSEREAAMVWAPRPAGWTTQQPAKLDPRILAAVDTHMAANAAADARQRLELW